jgi:hypothetical protein
VRERERERERGKKTHAYYVMCNRARNSVLWDLIEPIPLRTPVQKEESRNSPVPNFWTSLSRPALQYLARRRERPAYMFAAERGYVSVGAQGMGASK